MINRLVLCRVYYLINLFKGLGDTGSVRWFLLPLLLYIPFSISLPSFPRISSPGWAQVIGPLSQFRLADEVVLDCGLSSVQASSRSETKLSGSKISRIERLGFLKDLREIQPPNCSALVFPSSLVSSIPVSEGVMNPGLRLKFSPSKSNLGFTTLMRGLAASVLSLAGGYRCLGLPDGYRKRIEGRVCILFLITG